MATISKAFLICLTLCVLSISAQAEQTASRTWVAKSALHSVFSGHVVRLTIFEAGAPTVTSRATIEFRDGTNRVVARKEAALTPSSPVQLDVLVGDNARLAQVRAIVTVSTDSADLTAPLITFEDVNPDLGLVTKIDPPCGPGSPSIDAQEMCGWLVLTSPQ